ncbi:MAG TPA: hypothetical protein VK801_05830 [Caulobacteraceae bacterium]|jgi:hypothetical protein|nr:hypothetical protein [Caulobacteraceae bacterium]
MKLKTAAVVTAIVLATGLVACETATPYQPLQPGSKVYGGFTDTRLDADHYRVTFQGNSLTSRSTVENYLLYRAAQVTVDSGFDWFESVQHHTDTETQTYVNSFGPWGYGAFDPYWNVWGPGYGWRGFWGGPYWDPSFDIQTVQRFNALIDIVMGHGQKPPTARAFDAHQVIANLQPHIKLPEQKK